MNIYQKFLIATISFVFIVITVSFISISPPRNFPVDGVIEIERGDSLIKISTNLKKQGVIKVPRILDAVVIIFGGERSIVAGDYSFEKPINVFEVARRIIKGEHGINVARVRIQEGATALEISELFSEALPNFNQKDFLYLVEDFEGHLFPDTYIFFVTAKTEDVIDKILANFDRRLAQITDDVERSGKSLKEILTIASIIQKEAYNNYVEQQTISGILWKRLDKNMRLQVDATLKYYTGRGSAQLTVADLTTDHPYNTYTRGGLPPGPIGSPGLRAIRAAINPISSPYYYYLHDRKGQVYYAETHDGHVRNKNSYLR